jgi:hypothetical protein
VKGLREAGAAGRVHAMERITAGYVAIDDEIEALLLDALDDPGVYAFRTRDWDDADDEFGRNVVTRRLRVAAEAVKVLGLPKRRARSVAAIEARIGERGPDASATLYEALGELAPESSDRLLRDVEHPSERVRALARRALSRAIHGSTPAQKLAILARALDGLDGAAEADDWLRILEPAHGYFAPHDIPATREHVRSAGPSPEVVERWLASGARSVREIAISILAHRAADDRARAILARRIAEALPRQIGVGPERRRGHRATTEVELAVHILAIEVPDALARIREQSAEARAALRDYAVFELGRDDPGTMDGAPWFVAVALAKRLGDEDAVVEAVRAGARRSDPRR